MHIAAYKKIIEVTLPGISTLRNALDKKSKAFEKVIKIGRTHLMDATPLTSGRSFRAMLRNSTKGLQPYKTPFRT